MYNMVKIDSVTVDFMEERRYFYVSITGEQLVQKISGFPEDNLQFLLEIMYDYSKMPSVGIFTARRGQ